jgi:Nucleoside 2-deoxyribosyltransferase like
MEHERLIQSPKRAEISRDNKVIFLAGPIRGCSDWQHEATEKLLSMTKRDVLIANPRRSDWTDVNHDQQIDWETDHLNRASKNGLIVFWLANQEDFSVTSFSRTTRQELGEWLTKKEIGERLREDRIEIVIGFDDKFPGKEYILHRLEQSGLFVPVFYSLESVCKFCSGFCS